MRTSTWRASAVRTPTTRSPGCHIVADDELDAYARGRRLVGLFCQQGHFDRTKAEAGDSDLHALLPESARRAYDVHPLVEALLDSDDEGNLELRGVPGQVGAVHRRRHRPAGRPHRRVLANNPLRLGGCLNSESAEKAARLVRLCNAFGIPLVVVVDVPGYPPGVDQEWGGVVRRGAKLLHAFGEASVPRVTLVTRKIYGGAYIAMNSRSLGATGVRVAGRRGRRDGRQGGGRDPAQEEAGRRGRPRARCAARGTGGRARADRRRRRQRDRDRRWTRRSIPPTPAASSPRPSPRRRPGGVATRTSPVGIGRLSDQTPTRNPSAQPSARSRSPATRPMRVRRSRISSTVRAPPRG